MAGRDVHVRYAFENKTKLVKICYLVLREGMINDT